MWNSAPRDLKKFSFAFYIRITVPTVKNSHILAEIYFILLKTKLENSTKPDQTRPNSKILQKANLDLKKEIALILG